MTECERAKQWLSENWEGDFWDEDVRSLMQFMRGERARGMEEAAEKWQAKGGGTFIREWLMGLAYTLREEGGRGTDEAV